MQNQHNKKINDWLDFFVLHPIKNKLHPKVYEDMKHILDNPTTSLSTLNAIHTLVQSFVKHGGKTHE